MKKYTIEIKTIGQSEMNFYSIEDTVNYIDEFFNYRRSVITIFDENYNPLYRKIGEFYGKNSLYLSFDTIKIEVNCNQENDILEYYNSKEEENFIETIINYFITNPKSAVKVNENNIIPLLEDKEKIEIYGRKLLEKCYNFNIDINDNLQNKEEILANIKNLKITNRCRTLLTSGFIILACISGGLTIPNNNNNNDSLTRIGYAFSSVSSLGISSKLIWDTYCDTIGIKINQKRLKYNDTKKKVKKKNINS